MNDILIDVKESIQSLFSFNFVPNRNKNLGTLMNNVDSAQQEELVSERPELIQHIAHPLERVQFAALMADPNVYHLIKFPSKEMEMVARIRKEPYEIVRLINKHIVPTERMQIAAVTCDAKYIYILNQKGFRPSQKVQIAAIHQNPQIAINEIIKAGIAVNEKVQMELVSRDGLAIETLFRSGIVPSKKVQTRALEQNGLAIKFLIRNNCVLTEQMQFEAVHQNGLALQYITEIGILPTQRVLVEAIRQNPDAIQFVDEPDLDLQLFAVRRNSKVIKHIKKPFPLVLRLLKKSFRM